MIEGRSFLYQAQNQIVYHVNDEGVTAIESWSSSENIVAFVDGDKAGYEPDHILCKSGVQIILASPPKGATARWISQGQGHINIIATDLWSFRELFITGFVLGLLLSMLDRSISLGYSFIALISLPICSRSQYCISAATPVDALSLPAPRKYCTSKRRTSRRKSQALSTRTRI